MSVVLAGAALFAMPSASARANDIDVQNFHFEQFSAIYQLSRATDGSSSLRVSEVLVPIFPSYDQNRGLIRNLPNWFGSSPLEPEILGVWDEKGNPRPLDVLRDNEYTSVDSVTPVGSYLYGRQVFRIDYTMKNVVRDFAESSGFQEFYWDINGTGWAQRFNLVTAVVQIPQALMDSLNMDRVSCYRGLEGSDEPCALQIVRTEIGMEIRVSEPNLSPFETVTVAIPFELGTFETAERVPSDFPGNWASLALAIFFALVLVPYATWVRNQKLSDEGGRKTVVPEYSPPENLKLQESAFLLSKTQSLPIAQLLSMAVEGKILISESATGKFLITQLPHKLSVTDSALLKAILGSPSEGQALPIEKSDGVALAVRDWVRNQTSNAAERYLRNVAGGMRIAIGFTSVVTTLTIFGLTTSAFALRFESEFSFLGLLAPFLLWIPIVIVARKPLNLEGSLASHSLEGLRMYMKLAEKERLSFLQSVDGALRYGSEKHLKLHEKLLPYAVLFGLEKSWLNELSHIYNEASGSPAWLRSVGTLSIDRTLATFSNEINSSFAASSSGGSSRGGFAGGGGGGGGGSGR